MTTAIMTCVCEHKYQDKRYGKNRRVFNAKADRKSNMWNCTSCGKDRSGTAAMAVAANGKNGEENGNNKGKK